MAGRTDRRRIELCASPRPFSFLVVWWLAKWMFDTLVVAKWWFASLVVVKLLSDSLAVG